MADVRLLVLVVVADMRLLDRSVVADEGLMALVVGLPVLVGADGLAGTGCLGVGLLVLVAVGECCCAWGY